MQDIHIHNETDYDLPSKVINRIKLDAIEYFGDTIHAIRIQSGIERHTYNAKTREVRFAFFLSDYGLNHASISTDDDRPDPLHDTNFNRTYNEFLLSKFDNDDEEAVLAMIDTGLPELSKDDEVDLQVLETDLDEIDTTDFEFFDEDTLEL